MAPLNNLDKHKQNIIRRHARRREPLPDEVLKIRTPKSLPNPPGKPNVLMILPTLVMALSVGGISFFLSSGSQGGTRALFTAVPMLLMATMMISIQLFSHRAGVKQHIAEVQRINGNYQEHLEQKKQALERYANEQRRILQRENPPFPELLRRVERRAPTLWERQPFDNDFLAVRLGVGTRPICVEIKAPEPDDEDPRLEEASSLAQAFATVDHLPLVTNLNRLGTVGIRGQRPSEALYIAFTIISNLVVHHSPDEVNLYVISHRSDAQSRWGWAHWLPHCSDKASEVKTRLSFHLGTDEPLLLELSQLLRERSDTTRQSSPDTAYGRPEPHLVIVFDNVPALQGHIVMNMLLAHNPGQDENKLRASALFVETPIPPQINTMIMVNGSELEYRETWTSDANQDRRSGTAELTNPKQMEQLARSMAPLRTEENSSRGGGLPSSVRLVELVGATQPDRINLDRLYQDIYDARQVMAFPVGLDIDLKPQMVILRETGLGGYGSHAMLAGMTGTGKSVLLQAMVLSMAMTHSPQHLNVVLADFKGEGELGKIQDLPHVVGFVTDLLKPSAVERFRVALESELNRRNHLFASAERPVTNIRGYNKLHPEDPLPHLVILLDEFARGLAVNAQLRSTIDRIAAQGRSLGVHLILSTQRAADFDSKIRPNIDIRMSLRVASKEDSKIMFNRVEAFTNLTRPGQAYIQVGDNEIFEMFQAARADLPYLPRGTISAEQMDRVDDFAIFQVAPDGRRQLLYKHETDKKKGKADGVVRTEAEIMVSHIQDYCMPRYTPARVICLPPLPPPEALPLFHLLGGQPVYATWQETSWSQKRSPAQRLQVPVGMLDLPARQEQQPFIVDLTRRDGNFMVIGPAGAGKALFLRTLLLGLATTHTPADVHFYILGRGPALSVFEELPHCAALIRPAETERLTRLFDFLEDEVKRRRALMRKSRVDSIAAFRQVVADPSLPSLVVVFEDFAGLRAEHEEMLERVQLLAGDAKSVDIHLILSSNALNNVHVRIQDNFRNRLALGLKSRAEIVDTLGERMEVPDEIPGRGYTEIEQEVLECQVAAPERAPGTPVLSADETAGLRQIVAAMSEAWTGARPAPIEELPRYINLAMLWEAYSPVATMDGHLLTAPLGRDFDNLAPVTVDFNRFEPYSLVIGPSQSGKTEFLVTLCLAAAANLSPAQLEIVIVALGGNHLQLLSGLPHVRFYGARSQVQALLAQLAGELQERGAAARQAQETAPVPDTGAETVDIGFPRHTLLVVDGLQTAVRAVDNLSQLIDDCARQGQEPGINVIFADNATNLTLLKQQNFGFQSLQSACKYGCGVTFSVEQAALLLLNLQLPLSTVRAVEADMGKGRAFLAYQNRATLVQFATLASPHGDALADKASLKEIVEQIRAQYKADAAPAGRQAAEAT